MAQHNPNQASKELFELIEPVCIDAGYELVEIEYKQGGQGDVLRVFIDYPIDSGKTIRFSECVTLSRELSAILDVEEPIFGKYILEVSSPGIDRPLRTAEHFRRFIGKEVKVVLSEGIQGRRNFKGLLVRVSNSGAEVVVDVDGDEHILQLADLASAKLIPDWSSLMKGQGKRD